MQYLHKCFNKTFNETKTKRFVKRVVEWSSTLRVLYVVSACLRHMKGTLKCHIHGDVSQMFIISFSILILFCSQILKRV